MDTMGRLQGWLSKQSAASSFQEHTRRRHCSLGREGCRAEHVAHPDAITASFARRGNQPAILHKAVHQRAPLCHGQLRLQVAPRHALLRWLHGYLDSSLLHICASPIT